MPSSSLSRRERERLRHRDEILKAALDLFSQKGFHNVSMQEIARDAEFAIGTLYNFFKSKDELYLALMEETSRRFEDETHRSMKNGANEYERILSCAWGKARVFSENAGAIRLYFAETRGASFNIKAGMGPEIRQRYQNYLKQLAGLFRRGIERGLFHEADPDALALSLDSLINAAMVSWLDNPDGQPYEERVEMMLKIFFGPVGTEEVAPELISNWSEVG